MEGWETDQDGVWLVTKTGQSKRLVELKAHVDSPAHVDGQLRGLGAVHVSSLYQRDVYFAGVQGRLKLRFQRPGRDQLVHYDREDRASTKESQVQLSVLPPDHGLEDVLSRALGVLVVVTKQREVFEWDGTRVHLDSVEGLGNFLEFERVVSSDAAAREAHARLSAMLSKLGLGRDALRAGSYSDLLRSRASGTPVGSNQRTEAPSHPAGN
ncbi:MAG: class IV adenylate cyclase [Thermoplasmata archaeon]